MLQGLADGERSALAAIYQRHGAAAFALAQPICGMHAADVVDGACLALWRQARAQRGDGPIRGRLLRLTRQQALDRLHETQRHAPSSVAAAARQRAPTSLLELDDEDARTALAVAPAAERECLSMAYLDGLSVAEIATLAHLPTCAVTDYLHRGLQRVRDHLAASATRGRTSAAERLVRPASPSGESLPRLTASPPSASGASRPRRPGA